MLPALDLGCCRKVPAWLASVTGNDLPISAVSLWDIQMGIERAHRQDAAQGALDHVPGLERGFWFVSHGVGFFGFFKKGSTRPEVNGRSAAHADGFWISPVVKLGSDLEKTNPPEPPP